jgi:2'-5' RNA ligase
MQKPRYALVAYVNDPVAQFIKQIRRELHPNLPHLPAHLTVLPPRLLQDSESSALEVVEEICSQIEPFEVMLGEVETFIPVTPTVFIRVAHAHRVSDLHSRLCATKILGCQEEWPYLPHMTIVKMSTEAQAQEAYLLARRRWAEFEGSRCIPVNELTFVRETGQDRWADLAGIPLGRTLVSPHNS